MKMLSRIFLACVFLGLFCACSPLNCRWLDHKFRQYSENYLNLLNMMAYQNVNQDAEVNTVPFPHRLYNQASRASSEGKLAFIVQILKEVSALFEEDDREDITVEHFLVVVTQQAEELQLCVGSERRLNRRLHAYFTRFSHSVFGQLGHSAEAWELIRREIKIHLMRADHLVSSLLTAN